MRHSILCNWMQGSVCVWILSCTYCCCLSRLLFKCPHPESSPLLISKQNTNTLIHIQDKCFISLGSLLHMRSAVDAQLTTGVSWRRASADSPPRTPLHAPDITHAHTSYRRFFFSRVSSSLFSFSTVTRNCTQPHSFSFLFLERICPFSPFHLSRLWTRLCVSCLRCCRSVLKFPAKNSGRLAIPNPFRTGSGPPPGAAPPPWRGRGSLRRRSCGSSSAPGSGWGWCRSTWTCRCSCPGSSTGPDRDPEKWKVQLRLW